MICLVILRAGFVPAFLSQRKDHTKRFILTGGQINIAWSEYFRTAASKMDLIPLADMARCGSLRSSQANISKGLFSAGLGF
jgi:hypothetical protein